MMNDWQRGQELGWWRRCGKGAEDGAMVNLNPMQKPNIVNYSLWELTKGCSKELWHDPSNN